MSLNISDFDLYIYYVKIPIGIVSSAIGLKSCAITAGIKKSIIKKRKKHNKNSIAGNNWAK